MEENPINVEIANPLMATKGEERITILDSVRGFALLGILVVNMAYFSYPIMYLELTGAEIWTNIWDKMAKGFIDLFFDGKFYSMFSLLFGLGFVMFLERAQKRRARPTLLFYRRLFILLIFGLIHAFFIWFGDILVTYALLGLFLPLFYGRKSKTLLVWVIIFFLLAILLVMFSVLSVSFFADGFEGYMQGFLANINQQVESSLYAYSQGTFNELMAQRMADNLFVYNYLFFALPLVFPMFLLGLWAGKKKIFQNIDENLPFIRKIWLWTMIIGLNMSVIKFYSGVMIDPLHPSNYDIYAMLARVFADSGLSIFYICSIILLWKSNKFQSLLTSLANVGRMALSNYLLQSIICTTIFYSYGLGLYGKVGPAAGLILTMVIFILQINLSNKWLQKHSYGPMEWLWRKLTYGKI